MAYIRFRGVISLALSGVLLLWNGASAQVSDQLPSFSVQQLDELKVVMAELDLRIADALQGDPSLASDLKKELVNIQSIADFATRRMEAQGVQERYRNRYGAMLKQANIDLNAYIEPMTKALGGESLVSVKLNADYEFLIYPSDQGTFNPGQPISLAFVRTVSTVVNTGASTNSNGCQPFNLYQPGSPYNTLWQGVRAGGGALPRSSCGKRSVPSPNTTQAGVTRKLAVARGSIALSGIVIGRTAVDFSTSDVAPGALTPACLMGAQVQVADTLNDGGAPSTVRLSVGLLAPMSWIAVETLEKNKIELWREAGNQPLYTSNNPGGSTWPPFARYAATADAFDPEPGAECVASVDQQPTLIYHRFP